MRFYSRGGINDEGLHGIMSQDLWRSKLAVCGVFSLLHRVARYPGSARPGALWWYVSALIEMAWEGQFLFMNF
jgi:hypothetical protein